MSTVTYGNISLASGISVHYASAGSRSAPVVLLLHGYPTSSFQYRNLIPFLARHYRVIAPDLPGFGHTTCPSHITITFAEIAKAVGDFIDALEITRLAVYVFDYGAPTALRLALDRPNLISALITQNGNAFTEGLGPFWDPLKAWWLTGNKNDGAARSEFHAVLGDIDSTKGQYINGVPENRLARIDPKTYTFDYLHNLLPEEKRQVQIDLFWDYQTNIELYPRFQAWLKDSQVPVLAIWGKNDTIFVPAGATAFEQSRTGGKKGVRVVLLDGGHFLLETHVEEVADRMLEFLGENDL